MTLKRKVLLNTAVSILVLFSALVFLAWNQTQSSDLVRGMTANAAGNNAALIAELDQRAAIAWRVVAGVVLFILLERSFVIFGSLLPMARNVTNTLGLAQRIAAGDLRGAFSTDQRNEIGLVIGALSEMKHDLAAMVRDVAGTARTVHQAARDIQLGSLDLSQRTEEQMASLQQTGASMREFARSVHENREDAQQARRLTQEASTVANSSSAAVAAVLAGVGEVSHSSQRMDEIIALIDSIAFQTNVLALNAAVEAVRAGAHGRGFAVVAEEVRNLAQRSAAAAKEVRDLIAQSRNQIGAVVASVKQADASIGQVVAAVSNARTRVTRIAEACDFQSRAVDQIDATIERLSGITTLNAAAVERGVDVSDTLGLEAQRLVELVQRFQLDAADSAPPQDATSRLAALPR